MKADPQQYGQMLGQAAPPFTDEQGVKLRRLLADEVEQMPVTKPDEPKKLWTPWNRLDRFAEDFCDQVGRMTQDLRRFKRRQDEKDAA